MDKKIPAKRPGRRGTDENGAGGAPEAAAGETRNRGRSIVAFRLWTLRIIIVAALAFLAFRIISIKISYGDEYTRRAMAQLITTSSESDMTLNPNRGAILDRNKQPLAVSSIVYNVFLDVKMLLERSASDDKAAGEDTIRDTFAIVNEVLGTPISDLYALLATDPDTGEYINGKNQHLIFARNVKSSDEIILLQKKTDAIKSTNKVMRDIYAEPVSVRNYIYGSLASQVIGFMRGDTSYGLENEYNSYLTGVPGRIYETYSSGSVSTDIVDPVEGDTLITTLDLQLQQFIEPLCVKYANDFTAPDASIIVMNPNDGEILAMGQSPGFDPNDPMNADGVTDKVLADKIKQIDQTTDQSDYISQFDTIWKNFNTEYTMEPGSIFKPVTVAAALDEGVITTDYTDYCPGFKIVDGIQINCSKTTGHGEETLDQIIMNSCNVGLMDIGALEGRDIFYKYQRDFGYGEKTGIDLPGEVTCSEYSGLMYSLSGLNDVELATSSFGERFNCTPIQAITAFAALINGGTLYEPYLVSQMTDSNGNVTYEKQPTVVRKVISQATSDYLRVTMQKVISPEGTGHNAVIPGYAIGGKTGTGEQGVKDTPNYAYTLDFIAYLPVDDPQYLVLATIDHVPPDVYDAKSALGQASAAAMIKEVLQYLIDNKGIKPEDAAMDAIPADKAEVGDYANMPLSDAAHAINSAGLDFALASGSGTVVVAQSPAAGEIVSKGSTVWLTLKTEGDYALKEVPYVVGLDPDSAEAIIKDAGFVPILVYDDESPPAQTAAPDETEAPATPQLVYKQMPSSGIKVIEGMEVKLRIK